MTELDYGGLWPRITDPKREELVTRLKALEDEARSLADRVSPYAGGGGHANMLREAAATARDAQDFVQNSITAQ